MKKKKINKELKHLFFYVEPSTLLDKDLINKNMFIVNFLLDEKESLLSNIKASLVTILFKEEKEYSFYWKETQKIISKLNKYLLKIYKEELIFIASSIEIYRNKFSNKQGQFFEDFQELKKATNGDFISINRFNLRYNTNLKFIDNELYNIMPLKKKHNMKKLTGLPFLNFVLCFNLHKENDLNSNTLQQVLEILFENKLDIEIKIIEEPLKNNLKGALNYIWKNTLDIDTRANLKRIAAKFSSKNFFIFYKLLFKNLILNKYIEDYKVKNIFFYNIDNFSNVGVSSENSFLYLCVYEFIDFFYNNLNLYRFDNNLALFKLKEKSKFTFVLMETNFNTILHFCINNGYSVLPFNKEILLKNNYLNEFKKLIKNKFIQIKYPYFNYNGFEFLDNILDFSTFQIIKIDNINKFFTCFKFFNLNFINYCNNLDFNFLKIYKFLYYNNLSLDFFFYLGFLLNHLINPLKSLLNIHMFLYGSLLNNKNVLIISLLDTLFDSEKEKLYNLDTKKDLTSFKFQFLQKTFLWYDDIEYNKKDINYILKEISKFYKKKVEKYDENKILHEFENKSIVIFTSKNFLFKTYIQKEQENFFFKQYFDEKINLKKKHFFLGRILFYELEIPITEIYKDYNIFEKVCKEEFIHLLIIAFLVTGVAFQAYFKESNITSIISKTRLDYFFNSIFKLGMNDSEINSLYGLNKQTSFYNIPIEFSNISYFITKRLEVSSYEENLEQILKLYVTEKQSNN